MNLPETAQVVVVGGGIVGCSVAYHLVLRGVKDVLLLEQGKLTGGTTWHAAGLVSQLKSSQTLTRLATYSARLFERLEKETGQATGYRTPGSISVAADEERWEEIMRGASMARGMGIDAHPISMTELTELWPLVNTEDLIGALHLPEDGVTSPVDTTMALARGARDRGALIVEGVAVTEIRRVNMRVTGVDTEQGYVATDAVALCAGMWTRQLAATAGVYVPLLPCEHFYIVSEPIAGVYQGMPTMRDPGGYTYFKEEAGKIMAGFFEPRGKIWRLDDIPRDLTFAQLAEDWDHVGPVFEKAIHRVPALGEAGVQLFFNGPEAFTPDGTYHLGEAPELDGCYLAAGFNSVGIQSAGGAGWVLADWIVDGHPPMDLSTVDIKRTFRFESEPSFLRDRLPESLGLLYAMHWPYRQYETGRGILRSPLHDRLVDAGAVFGSVAGWERPNWFARSGMEKIYRYSYGRQNWFAATAEECNAVRASVGLFDQTSFGKYLVKGNDAFDCLNQICANDIDVEPGRVVYTQWLNERGGIEADVTVNRRSEDEFLVVGGAATRNRDLWWMRRHTYDRQVEIMDLTEEWAMLGLMGPGSRTLLETLTGVSLTGEVFPFGASRVVELAGVEVMAVRMTYVGELGWELYLPVGGAGDLYDALMTVGLTPVGFHAMDCLRLEAGYRHWGHDITYEDTPIEAGLGFAVAYDKAGGFSGREALLATLDRPRRKRLVQFRLESSERLLYHDEPIYRDDVLAGHTTSGAWGHTVSASLAMGYVMHNGGVDPDYLAGGLWEIEIAGNRCPAGASLRPWYLSPTLRS